MHCTTESFSRHRLARAVLAVAVVATLAGCAPEGTDVSPSATPTPSASASPSTSPSASASPSASPSDDPHTVLDADCLDLVSLDTMYDFDPNFGLVGAYTPAAGTLAADAAADGGIACSWVQQTSGATIDIAAAKPGDLATRAAAAGVSGDGSVFNADGLVGSVQVFDGEYWVVLTSTYFTRVADAQPLIDSVLDAFG